MSVMMMVWFPKLLLIPVDSYWDQELNANMVQLEF